jgi:UDP-GlcNAc:undecaprenyl-phosphate GlcNAc-1-phosphate transferase
MLTVIIITIINLIILYKIDYLTKLINIYDIPNEKRKIHQKKVSKIGGIIILLNILIIYSLSLFEGNIQEIKKLNFLLFTSILIFIIGIIDDLKDLKPNLKLLLFFLIIIFFLYNEKNLVINYLRFSFIEDDIYLGNFSVYFTALCVLLFINAINMFDGINLQVILYSSLLFVANCYFFGNLYLILLFIPLILILIILNYKNKLFLGDNGTLLLGFLISCYFIINYNYFNIKFADTIFIFMMLPGLELIRLAISRILKKKNPFSADNTHIHHLLLKKYKYNSVIIINFVFILLPILILFLIQISSLVLISIFSCLYLVSIYWLSKY